MVHKTQFIDIDRQIFTFLCILCTYQTHIHNCSTNSLCLSYICHKPVFPIFSILLPIYFILTAYQYQHYISWTPTNANTDTQPSYTLHIVYIHRPYMGNIPNKHLIFFLFSIYIYDIEAWVTILMRTSNTVYDHINKFFDYHYYKLSHLIIFEFFYSLILGISFLIRILVIFRSFRLRHPIGLNGEEESCWWLNDPFCYFIYYIL